MSATRGVHHLALNTEDMRTSYEQRLSRGVEEMQRDVEGVIIDGAASATEYLHLLATLPTAYAGDVVLIDDDYAFVSATGRGGDRVLYTLRAEDVQFYLEAKMLVAPVETVAA